MGQSSDEPINAGMPAGLFSKREIEACVSRVGVHDRLQFAGSLRASGWSTRLQLISILRKSLRVT